MPARKNTRRTSAATRKKNNTQAPAWLWLVTGLLLGAFLMFLFKLSQTPSTPAKEEVTSVQTKKPAKKPEKETPRFDFYELLKETEVGVEKEPPTDTLKKEAPPVVEADEVHYILQVASFRTEKDAERVRAQLILLNLEAHAQKAVLRNGESWHRVLVGPFQSKSKLAKARETLISNGFEALVLKKSAQG